MIRELNKCVQFRSFKTIDIYDVLVINRKEYLQERHLILNKLYHCKMHFIMEI